MSYSLKWVARLAVVPLFLACGGGDSVAPPPPPPPPAPVASVLVTPGSGNLIPGDTLRLSATPRNDAGQPLSGRSVQWTTSDPARATVSGTGLVQAMAPGAVSITATSEGKQGTAQLAIGVPAPVVVTPQLDAAAAASAQIGVAGGTLTATRSNGTTYTLTIPPNALREPTTITLTPVAAIGGLPLSGGLAGGVEFAPDGLVLALPATLVIELPVAPQIPAGQRLIGFGYAHGGGAFHPAPAAISGRTITLPVPHFSGGGAGYGTVADVSMLTHVVQTSAEYNAQTQILGYEGTSAWTGANINIVYSTWYGSSIKAALTGANTDQQAVNALSEYGHWKTQLENDPRYAAFRAQLLTDLSLLRREADSLAAEVLRRGLTRADLACRAAVQVNVGLILAGNMHYWQVLAAHYRLDGPASGLTAADVVLMVEDCVKLEVFPTFPGSVPQGQATPLPVQVSLRLRTILHQGNLPVSVTLTPSSNASVAPGQGPVNAGGGFSATVIPPSAPFAVFGVTVRACINQLQYPLLGGLCGMAVASSQTTGPIGPGTGQCRVTAPFGYLIYGGGDGVPPLTPWTFEPGTGRFLSQAQADSVVRADRVLIGVVQGQSGETVELACLEKVIIGFMMNESKAGQLKLPALAEVGAPTDAFSSIAIIGNDHLTAITLGAATTPGMLIIRNNPLLTDVSGIARGFTARLVEIYNNANLCRSQIEALRDRINTSDFRVSGNKEGC